MSKDIFIAPETTSPAHTLIRVTPVQKIYVGNNEIWRNTNSPVITAFSVSPNNIDLDSRASGTITFAFSVTGTAGQITYAQIVRLPGGESIGATFVGASGANINGNLPNILQPSQTTIYRVIARNDAGSSYRDTTVTVTQNPVIRNFRRTAFRPGRAGISGPYYEFEATIVGYPRPGITYQFSGGQQGTLDNRHFTASGTNTWTVRLSQTFATTANQSLLLTAQNSSGTVTARISNINT